MVKSVSVCIGINKLAVSVEDMTLRRLPMLLASCQLTAASSIDHGAKACLQRH